MICGVGTDIVDIARIRGAVEEWGDHFLKKIFNDDEITYCYSKGDPALHLAARFAAKEAGIKALSSGRGATLSMKDFEVSNDESGKPSIKVNKDGFSAGAIKLHLSISHERNYAVATVIAEE
jgi:holo-[acyl-carrier protein] synthase